MSEEKKPLEELMREFTPRPAPPELKRRILAAASKSRELGGFLSRPQLRAAAVLGLMMTASLVGDAWFEGRSARAWKALESGNAYGLEAEAGIDRDMAQEISGGDRNLGRQILSRLEAEMALRRFSRPEMSALPGDI
jgi:hypothetical protein